MTPSIKLLNKQKINYKLHEYTHNTNDKNYGLEASQLLNISEKLIYKTLVVKLNTNILAVAIIPVSSMLSMKLVAKVLDVKKATMATTTEVKNSTGYILGGVSPFGQKKKLKTIIDITATQHDTIYVSGGRRGLEIELNPNDLKELTNGSFDTICL